MWLSYKRDHLPFVWMNEPGLIGASLIWKHTEAAESTLGEDASGWGGVLLGLLSDLQDFQAHDPRDHVYGLLGLYQKS